MTDAPPARPCAEVQLATPAWMQVRNAQAEEPSAGGEGRSPGATQNGADMIDLYADDRSDP